jgi:hypothetical protein
MSAENRGVLLASYRMRADSLAPLLDLPSLPDAMLLEESLRDQTSEPPAAQVLWIGEAKLFERDYLAAVAEAIVQTQSDNIALILDVEELSDNSTTADATNLILTGRDA